MPEINHSFPYEVIRSQRRQRIALRVKEGKVALLMPQRGVLHEALLFLDKHSNWVHKKLGEQAVVSAYQPKEFVDGEVFNYLGKSYLLIIAYARQPMVILGENQLFVFIRASLNATKRQRQIQRQLQRWYWQQAEQQLQQKSQAYALQLQLHYRSITVKQFKSRWGSCSSKADIQYNWQIIMAPHAIINYLVVHELAHLKHPNHSAPFWRLVATLIPDYKIAKQWLKTHGHLLRIQ